jgi:hypothetical protein
MTTLDTQAGAAHEAMRRFRPLLPAWECLPDAGRTKWRDAVSGAVSARTLYEGYSPLTYRKAWSELSHERRAYWTAAWEAVLAVRAPGPAALKAPVTTGAQVCARAADGPTLRARLAARRQAEAVAR